ncbi:class I SAM-dependent methyltransferase [Marinibaculum pumilum]|uniref:Class I SAM-dependent methyltransferase n=1 Tax=Marinibaculum pumilum TaxID=1766165 RepID=A0ABV7L976_9PROT
MAIDAGDLQAHFADPAAVARYAEGPPRFVPGFADLHRMAAILLAEVVPDDARLLVLGAGGGLELKAFAAAQPGWRFDGVDPAPEMLALAGRTMGPLADRARLHCGTIDDAPDGPFDAATCLLVLHFLDAAERRRTAEAVRRRLKPGAPFIAAHSSFPQAEPARARWLDRYAAFAIASGADPGLAWNARAAVDRSLALLPPEADEAILREAGFRDVTPFYAAFTWRGWVGYA